MYYTAANLIVESIFLQEGVVRAAGSLAVFVLAGLGLRWPRVAAAAAAVPAAAALVSMKVKYGDDNVGLFCLRRSPGQVTLHVVVVVVVVVAAVDVVHGATFEFRKLLSFEKNVRQNVYILIS